MITVELEEGKYTINLSDQGKMSFLRNGETWDAANEDFRHVKLISAAAYRIHELEEALAVAQSTITSVQVPHGHN